MVDVMFTCTISRDLLGGGPLNLNDHIRYRVASIQPGETAWRRKTATSAYLDGEVTTQRTKNRATARVVIDVLGSTQVEVNDNYAVLVEAFEQDTFTFTFTLDSQTHAWLGEAADRSNDFGKERMHALMPQVEFSFPRQPTSLSGVV